MTQKEFEEMMKDIKCLRKRCKELEEKLDDMNGYDIDFPMWIGIFGIIGLVSGICMNWTFMFLCGMGMTIYGIMKEFE